MALYLVLPSRGLKSLRVMMKFFARGVKKHRLSTVLGLTYP